MKGGPKVNNSRQLANDLRRTHFTLGTAAPKNQSSEYVAEYQRKQAAFEMSQKDKLNLRASHFEFGPHDPSKTFVTLHQKDYKEHVGFQAPKLNEEKKRDLRSSHFVLGNYHAPYASLNHANFTEKSIPIGQQKQEQEEQKNKMRKHNHDFTETNKKHFSSEYHTHFNKQIDPNSLKQGLSPAELRQKVVDLRKSHVVLGGDHKPMQSIAQQDYQFRPGTILPAANDNVNIRRTNFKLGTDQGDMASMYQSYFVKHPKAKVESLGALGQDLRATHFSLGQEAPMYATTTAGYRGPPVGFKPAQTLNPNLQKNHFTIGDQNVPACGGAAMRKRLLIKNFVAQMLQQDRPLVYFDEGLDLHYGKSENDNEMDDPEKHEDFEINHNNKVEQGNCGGRPNKKNGSLSSDDSESDEEEEEVEEEDDDQEAEVEEEQEAGSDEEEEEEEDYDDSTLYDDNGTTALSMVVHRQTDISHYGDSSNLFYSTDDQHRSIQTTPLPSASTLCSGNSSMEMWADDDSYSLLSLNSSQSRAFNDPMMAAQDENIFYSASYQHSYMMSSGGNDAHQNQVSLGGYIDQSNVVNDGFIEDVTLCEKLDKLNDNFGPTDDEVSLTNGPSFTSLVNMNSPVKLGNQSFDDQNNLLLAYRRSITDLDTNTVVEEDDFSTDNSTTSTLNVRSPKKRPFLSAQNDDFYNLTLSSSPKRLKL